MEQAIKLAKELISRPKDLRGLPREAVKEHILGGMQKSKEFENYCYEHNFHPQRIKDMATEELEKENKEE